MTSTFHGIEMGKRSLITNTQVLNVVGHNLNNLNTDGYSRQVIHLQAFEPIYMPDLTREERRIKSNLKKNLTIAEKYIEKEIKDIGEIKWKMGAKEWLRKIFK